MAYITKIFLILLVIKLSSGRCPSTKVKWCINSDYFGSDGGILDKESCKTQPCIVSTCPNGYMIYRSKCVRMDSKPVDFSQLLTLHRITKSGETVTTDKNFFEKFQVVTYINNTIIRNNNCTLGFYPIGEFLQGHFLEDGSFFLKPDTIIPPEEYIVRFTIDDASGVLKPLIKINIAKDQEASSFDQSIDLVYDYAMLASVFFMILVTIVYILCKELRTNAGLNFMTYVSTLAIAFFLTAARSLAMEYSTMEKVGCYVISTLIHFFTFSSYMWMNIMGIDIWWTLRNMFYQRRLDPKAVNYRKYLWHCTIAFGPTLAYVIIEIGIDELAEFDGPLFSKCTSCSNELYLQVPNLILQTINFIPLTLLIYNLVRLQKSNVKQLNSADSNNTGPKQNAFLCLKISVMLGTNWFMDVMLSFFYDDLPGWFKYTIKAYNSLFGLILFLVYIFKADVLLKLFKRLSINNKITKDLEKRVSRKYSNTRKYSQNDSNSSTVWQNTK